MLRRRSKNHPIPLKGLGKRVRIHRGKMHSGEHEAATVSIRADALSRKQPLGFLHIAPVLGVAYT